MSLYLCLCSCLFTSAYVRVSSTVFCLFVYHCLCPCLCLLTYHCLFLVRLFVAGALSSTVFNRPISFRRPPLSVSPQRPQISPTDGILVYDATVIAGQGPNEVAPAAPGLLGCSHGGHSTLDGGSARFIGPWPDVSRKLET